MTRGITGTSPGVDSASPLYSPATDATNYARNAGSGPDIGAYESLLDIVVEQPAGTNLTLGGTKSFGTVVQGGTASLIFTIKNLGAGNLTGLTVTKDGLNATDFTITANPTAPVTANGSTTFTVQFAPAAGGALTLTETATVHIANNVTGKNPFDINLTGKALSCIQDTDSDGMNDAAEFLLATLGFDWQVSQPTLVSTYYANANAANLFSLSQYNANRTAGQNDVTNSPNTYNLYPLSQVQALNVGAPLLTKDQTTGNFKLTIGVQKATDLIHFNAFPMSGTGITTTINAQGKLEFVFPVSDNAAFFKVQAQ